MAERPNIILIINDDLGWGNMGCDGSPDMQTPHLDRLAAGGVRLTDCYTASPVCTPARAALLTGRHPERSGVNRVLRQEDDGTGMALAEITLADLLAGAGYHTALVGKWHLGIGPDYRPTRRGFQEYYGILNGMIDYDTHISLGGGGRGEKHFYRNETRIDPPGYFTDLVTQEACAYLERQTRAQPFFLTVAHTAPHLPLQAPDHALQRFGHIAGEPRRTFAAMVACMDDGIGRIVETVHRQGMTENTVIVFISDHGWDARKAEVAVNGPFRGGKYFLYEGGIRVPCIVAWPGHLPTGSLCHAPVIGMDWFVTLLAWAGCQPPQDRAIDGKDIRAVLSDPDAFHPYPHDHLCWVYHKDDLAKAPEQAAIRRDGWKLLLVDGQPELYNLTVDPGEQRNLAGVVAHDDLLATLETWLRDVPRPAIGEGFVGTGFMKTDKLTRE